MNFGRDIVEVMSLIIGLALAGLIITRASNTATVVKAAGGTFNDVLRTATFQNAGFTNYNSGY